VEVLPALEGAQPVTAFIVFWNIFVLATAADPWDVEEARVLAEHREYLIAQAQQGMAMPTLYVAGCDGDHDGSSWSGPTRFSWDDATADIAAHKSEWPSHGAVEGGTVEPTAEGCYVAGCGADHDGASWSGPLRATFDEAADDLVAHVYEWPDHQLAVDDGRAKVHVEPGMDY